MPITGTGPMLGDAILAAIDGVGDKTDRKALFEAMGTAIVAHITANALVMVSTPGGPGTGPVT